MRIMFLYMFPLYGNGSGVYLQELVAELIKRGHKIAIVSPDKRKLPGAIHYVVNPPQMGVFIGHPELPNGKKFEDMNGKELGDIFNSYLKTTIDAVNDFQPEIIHVFHTAFLPGIARIIKVLFGIKFVITTHGSDLSYLTKDRRFSGLINDANKLATCITANSGFTRRWYLQMFGQNLKRKTSIIMGGVNIENYRQDPEEIKVINQKYGLEGKKVVLFTGRLTEVKGVIYLVRAASAIKGTVLIVGDGPERKKLEEEVKKRNLKNVVLAGYINPKNERFFHAFYERADVYVSPSVWEEPLGLTILEAMAAHTPVVATKKGGVIYMVKDKINGFLIRSRNSKQISETVNMLLENDALREKIGEEAYRTVLENFTWSKRADKFEKIYKEFKYSTTEYLNRVKGTNPQLANFLRTINKFFG